MKDEVAKLAEILREPQEGNPVFTLGFALQAREALEGLAIRENTSIAILRKGGYNTWTIFFKNLRPSVRTCIKTKVRHIHRAGYRTVGALRDVSVAELCSHERVGRYSAAFFKYVFHE